MPRPDSAATGEGKAAGNDAALAARLVSGDEGALEELSSRFSAAMHAVAHRVTRSDRLAEEVVQDVLMAVWREPSRFDPARGSLSPWLLTMTRYKAIDALRREAVVRRHTAEVDLELRQAPDDVHEAAWLRVRRERLGEAIARLPEDQRRALELAFLGGLTHVEAAEREGIPLGTAKTRIRTALLKLRQDLAPAIGPEVPAARQPTPDGRGSATTLARSATSADGPIRQARGVEPGAAAAARRAVPQNRPQGGMTDA